MSAVEKLEALINIKEDLKSQYEGKLLALGAKIKEHEEKHKTLQATIDLQLEKITELSSTIGNIKQLEQTNRELSNRAEKFQGELNNQKAKAKLVLKELTEVKSEAKQLKQLDAEKLKKNLVATKKKLTEKTTANELLSKSLNKTKAENVEFQSKISELEEELKTLKPEVEANAETETEAKTETDAVETSEKVENAA